MTISNLPSSSSIPEASEPSNSDISDYCEESTAFKDHKTLFKPLDPPTDTIRFNTQLIEPPPSFDDNNFDQQVDTKDIKPTPLPFKPFLALTFIMFQESFSTTILFPWIGLMVDSFPIVTDPSQVGYYAGIIASTFSFAEFSTAYFYGKLSDIFGRRMVFFVGSIGTGFFFPLFGMSKTFISALIFRFICGSFNGNLGAIKACIADLTDNTNRTQGFAISSVCWGLGSLLGPAVGGFLVAPADKYPDVFDQDGLFGQFPFLLPCLAVSFVCFMGFISGLFFLPETNPEAQSIKAFFHTKVAEILSRRSRSPSSSFAFNPSDSTDSNELPDSSNVISPMDPISLSDSSSLELEEIPCSRPQPSSNLTDSFTTNETETGVIPKKSSLLSQYPALKNSIVYYSILGLSFMGYSEIFPLWILQSPSNGGLGFNSNDVGFLFIIAGGALIPFQLYILSPLERALGGTYKLATFSTLASALFFFLIPFTNMIRLLYHTDSTGFGKQSSHLSSEAGWGTWVAIVIVHLSLSLVAAGAFTTAMVLINNSVPRNLVGAANGTAQSAVALTRALGPVGFGAIFSWSLSYDTPPFDFHFVFVIITFLLLLDYYVLRTVPKSVYSFDLFHEESTISPSDEEDSIASIQQI